MPGNIFKTPVEYLKGVGPQRADLLKKELSIFTYADLLLYFPYRYIDRSSFQKIRDIQDTENYIQVKGVLYSFEIIGKGRGRRMVAQFSDNSGSIELVWFKGISWVQKFLEPGKAYVAYGKPNYFKGKYSIPHPEMELVSERKEEANHFYPVYNSTEKLKAKGLHSKGISKLVKTLLPQVKGKVPENLSETLTQALKLVNRDDAIQNVHFPASKEMLSKTRYRLKFEELFFIQLRILKLKHKRNTEIKGFIFKEIGDYFNKFYKEILPFKLTQAQKRVIREIRHDVAIGEQMNRLLQGDVGSGKTIVALMTMFMALDNNFQACLMAPTEILAKQHYETIKDFTQELGITTALLTGSTKKSSRKELNEKLTNGNNQVLIGTHALIEDTVKFSNLGLVVIDEQHRFGVAQRAKLWKKNIFPPHVLVMTATPIPRTLAMTVYGDLNVSVIDELPPGRKPVKTIHTFDKDRLKVFGFMKDQIKKGRQIYVVYPLIEESEKLDLKDLMDGYESIVREFPLPEYAVSILHGKMKPADKDYEMQRFVEGKTNIMVSTTVIEVGVDVPNASVMVIENAERFGLSQLHQLRGRVGRGADQSFCILMSSYKLTEDGKKRLQTMVSTNDGFKIAEVDLELRGPGDIEGTQQSGVLDLKMASLATDGKILDTARKIAMKTIDDDPALEKPQNLRMKRFLNNIEKNRTDWSKIS